MSRFRLGLLAVIAVGSFVGGGWLLRHGLAPGRPTVMSPVAPGPAVGSRLFQDVLRHVRSYAVDSLEEPIIYRLAAAGMLDELDDPYAALVPAESLGVAADTPVPLGLHLDRDERLVTVVSVRPNSPADHAGVRPGDVLLEVGGVSVDGRRPDEVAALIARQSREVRLRLGREGDRPIRVTVERGPVPPAPRPEVEPLGDGVARVTLWTLAGAAGPARALAEQAVASGQRSLVLDLRGVVEGTLDDARAVGGLFLPRGSAVALVRGRATNDSSAVRTDVDPALGEIPLVVLVDRGTSGAAEALAGALQDHDRALLVGAATFGRGAELSTYPVGNGLVLRLTTSHWYTPSGRGIQRRPPPAPAVGDDSEPADSVARPTFRTDGGRVVYGGGGIVPDREVSEQAGERSEGDQAIALARSLLARARSTRTLLSLDSR